MPIERALHVHFLASSVDPKTLVGGVAVVLDVLRATTTMIHALAAGCVAVRPCGTIEEARALAESLSLSVLLIGERDGLKVAGFDLGNSPEEFTAERCR